MINSGVQAAAASPRGDGGVLRRNSGSGTPQGSAQGSETAAAVNAAAFAAQLLPRLEGVEGETGAMEERIVQRVEVRWGRNQDDGVQGYGFRGLGQEVGGRTGDGAGTCVEQSVRVWW